MATLIANGNGSISGAAVFAAAEAGAGALNLVRNTAIGCGIGSITSVAFTVTNGSVIDGVLMFVQQSGVGLSGTFKVDLQKGGVSQASVTVNKTDLTGPPNFAANTYCPTLFKLTSNATGDGAANWTIVITNTGVGNVNFYGYTGTASNFTHALRTTTPATAAATDNLFIGGELTGSGWTPRSVTMDSVAITVYGSGVLNSTSAYGGGIYIGPYGTLAYANAAATNYIMRVNGDIHVHQFGTFNMGVAGGAEIPRTSTAVLEFQQNTVGGDFGLRCYDGSTTNMAGQSWTAGKDIVKAKLTADVLPFVTVLGGGTGVNCAQIPTNGWDATGNTANLLPNVYDNATNGPHGWYFPGPVAINITHTAFVYVARGYGTTNRYFRFMLGNNTTYASITNGFYADFDLQAGTVSAITNIGNGAGASVSMTPCGAGFILRLTGICSTASATVTVHGYICSAPGTVVYVGNSTSSFIYRDPIMVVASSVSDTVFNVDTDTGWPSGAAIVVASTTRTTSDTNLYPLTANATATQLTTALHPYNIHNGLYPIAAEVGLINHNVKIRSSSYVPNVQGWAAYIYCTFLAVFKASWVEFYYLGPGPQFKRGIELDGSPAPQISGLKSFTYCSMHDFPSSSIYFSGGYSMNLTFSNNVVWMCVGNTQAFYLAGITIDDFTVTNNLFMRSNQVVIGSVRGTFSNNVIAGSNHNFIVTEGGSTMKKIGNFDNNTVHSSSSGLQWNGYFAGEMAGFSAWRNSNWGLYLNSSSLSNFTLVNPLIFGNYSSDSTNVDVSTDVLNVRGGTICSDVTFTSRYGFRFNWASLQRVNMSGVDMSGTGGNGIFAPQQVYDFWMTGGYTVCNIRGSVTNCKFGAGQGVPFSPATYIGPGAALGFMNYNLVQGDNRVMTGQGWMYSDSVNYHGTPPSVRMAPNSNDWKLETAPAGQGKLVAVNNGQTATVSVWVRKDPTYIGAQPRLMVRANPNLGLATNTVLATATGTTATPAYAAFGNQYSNVLQFNNNLSVMNTLSNQINANIGTRVGGPAGEKTSGKFYIELKTDTTTVNNCSYGVGPATTGYEYFSNTCNGGGAGFNPSNGWIYVNNSSVINLGVPAGGAWVGIAYDFDLRLFWVRNSPTGNWNGNASYSPVTAVGGQPIPAGSLSPMIGWNIGGSLQIGNVITANFGASAFAGAVPSGFTAGWTMAAGTPGNGTWAMLTGTSPVAIADGAFEFYVDCDGTAGFINVDDWVPTTTMVGYAPINIVAPVTNNATNVGQTIIATSGSWLGVPAPTYAYQWKRNGVNIAGATTNSYVIVTGDIGSTLSATVTATNATSSVSATTASVGPIAAAFDPAALPGIIAWYDASAAGNFSLTGSQVNTFNDKSGLAQHMQWTGFGKPTYAPAGFNSGYPALMIDTAVGSAMQATPFAMGSGNTLTVCLVTTQAGASSNGSARWIGYAAPTTQDYNSVNSWCINFSGALNNIRFTRNSADVGGSAPGSASTPHVIIATVRSDGFATVYVDGVVVGSGALAAANWITGGVLNIGRQSPSGTAYLTAPFAEVIVTTAYSDASIVAQLTSFEKFKWDFALTGAPPMNTVAPTLSGSMLVGSVLTGTDGSWTGSPTVTHKWQRNGVDISGATSTTYTTVSGDTGTTISFVVTASNLGGTTVLSAGGLLISASVLDGLSPTAAWSASRKLVTAYGGAFWTPATGTLSDQSGAARHLSSAAGSERPTAVAVGGILSIQYDGVNNQLYNTGVSMEALITRPSGYMIMTFRITTFRGTGVGWQSVPLINSSDNNAGMGVSSNSGGSFYVSTWDGGGPSAVSVISANTVYVAEWRHEGGVLYGRINGGAEFTVNAGTSYPLGFVRFGHWDIVGNIFEAATFQTIPSLGTRNALVKAFGAYAGAAV